LRSEAWQRNRLLERSTACEAQKSGRAEAYREARKE